MTKRGQLTCRAPGQKWRAPQLIDFGRAIAGLLRGGKTVVVADLATDDRLDPAERERLRELGIASALLHPVTERAGTTLALLLHQPLAYHWSELQSAALRETAERAAHAMQWIRDHEVNERRLGVAALTTEALVGFNGLSGLADSMQCLVERLVPLVGDYATVEAHGAEHEILALTHCDSEGLSVLRALRERHRLDGDAANSAARAARSGDAQLLPIVNTAVQAEYATTAQTAALLAKLGPRSHLEIPLDLGTGRPGLLLVGVSDPARASFDDDDLAYVQEIARSVEVALAAERVRRAEHDIALTLQTALLPDSVRWNPAAAVEARYRAADEMLHVGGDWYDTFAWPDGKVGVMVGDVVGHTVESAAAMGRLRAAASALAAVSEPNPATILEALDRFARSPDGVDFATAACLIIDPETGSLEYACAGHPPPLVVDPQRVVCRLDQAQSPPLAAVQAGPRPYATVALDPGSLVVLYSDGLIERRREVLDVGLARLESAIVERLEQPIGEIIDGVIDALLAASPATDDVVVAAFRYTPILAHLKIEAPARSDQLASIRRRIKEWLNQCHVDRPTQAAIQSAIGEACANVIEHAYRRHDGRRSNGQGVQPTLEIELADYGHEVVARIIDHGYWRPPGPHNHNRGFGTPIMRTLTSRYEHHFTEHGTTTTLAIPTVHEFEMTPL
jgi:serine phosphatase RsbU (regulator of sigma subunit)/anti-sigma regulatory factor (Ser/Thr protein kinase)